MIFKFIVLVNILHTAHVFKRKMQELKKMWNISHCEFD